MSHLQISLCLEVQRPSQTTAERGEAELRILDFQTTWSEFQKTYQTAAVQGTAELSIYNLKKISPPHSWSQAVVCVSTTRKYPHSGYFLVLNIYKEFCVHFPKLYNPASFRFHILHFLKIFPQNWSTTAMSSFWTKMMTMTQTLNCTSPNLLHVVQHLLYLCSTLSCQL